MKSISRDSKRGSVLTSIKKEFFDGKLFPLPSTRQDLQKRINTYNSFSNQQVHKILSELIQIKKFKQLVCKSLQVTSLVMTKLQHLYRPIISILQEQYEWAGEKAKISELLEILIEGKFFRKLPKQTYAFFVNNNRSTETSVSCIIAAILVCVSGRLNIGEIERILKVFEFQEKLSESNQFGITIEYQRVLKILKKLQRKVKPIEFKQWMEDLKKDFNAQKIENFHFLYLISLTQLKTDQISFTFMDFNLNKDKKGKNLSRELQKEEDAVQGEKKEQKSQNQKYRMKSFSYIKNSCTLPSVVAFPDIKSHIHQTQEKLKQKKKSLTLLSRIKNRYQSSNQEEIFKQITFPQNKINLCLRQSKMTNHKSLNSIEGKSRAFSTNENTSSKLSTPQQSRKTSKNKENQNLLSQRYQEFIKQTLVLNFPKNKQKKLVLNKDQQRINHNFEKVFNYHEKKIENEMRSISKQRQ